MLLLFGQNMLFGKIPFAFVNPAYRNYRSD